MKPVTYTNNMSPDLLKWVGKYSTEQKLTRRTVIEKALTEFRNSVRRKEYAESFKEASLDTDILSMSEDGMGDYFAHLKHLEK